MKKLVLIGLVALSSSSITYAGEIADLHQKLSGSKPSQWSRLGGPVTASKKSGITEIGLERTRCYGTCPAYSVLLKSDGTVRYKGEAYVPKIGVRTGKVDSWKFEQLAKYIEDSGYMNLQNTYTVGITDSATVYTTVRVGSKRKVVSNYANSGPVKLWGVEQLIDKIVLETQWNDEKPTPAKP